MNNTLQDKALVKEALNGEEKAFSSLLSKYKNTIYSMMMKMVNNVNDAEDLTFEAFAKAFKNIHRYSPKYAFSTWLFKIAYNNCIDFIRNSKGTLDENKLNKEWEKIKSAEPDPEQRLIRIQRAVFLRHIVRGLNPSYRTLIDLRYFKEYSYEEIAEELGIPMGTVKAHLFRARNMLMKIIESENVEL